MGFTDGRSIYVEIGHYVLCIAADDVRTCLKVMSPAASILPARKSAPRRKKKRASRSFWTWWPVLLGIAMTPLAVRAAGVLALSGPSALRLLYPYVLLLQGNALGLPTELASHLSQGMMYLQFPLYGLVVMLSLRSRSLLTSLMSAVVVHFAAILALLLTASMT